MTDNSSIIDELLATAAPRTITERVCARGDLVAAHEAAVLELNEALQPGPDTGSLADSTRVDDDELERRYQAVRAIEEQMDTSTVEITLQAIGAQAWADLLRTHPPGKEHRGMMHHPHTFPPAAVAACALTPKISEEQAAGMFATLHSAEWSKLWVAAVRLNEHETPHPKLGAVVDLLRAKRPSDVSPVTTGSLAEPSSVDDGAQ